jgi:hypothetical protein
MSKLLDYSASLWMGGVLVFMVLSLVVGIVQSLRGKKDFDIPAFVLAPIVWLWLIIALAGIVTVMLGMLVLPVVHWFMH